MNEVLGLRRSSQKLIQLFAALVFIGLCIVSSAWPAWVFLSCLTAATIEVANNQEVISTGPYAIVRHPMYSGGLVMLFGSPLALGSWWGLLMFIPLTFIIAWRLLDEESCSSSSLSGYPEYRQNVRYRLVPFIW